MVSDLINFNQFCEVRDNQSFIEVSKISFPPSCILRNPRYDFGRLVARIAYER